MVCTSPRCNCGQPITIRMIGGRRTPIHLKK